MIYALWNMQHLIQIKIRQGRIGSWCLFIVALSHCVLYYRNACALASTTNFCVSCQVLPVWSKLNKTIFRRKIKPFIHL